MVQKRPITPEKQLLKLIEGPDYKKEDTWSHAIKQKGLSFLSPGAWLGRISYLRQNIRNVKLAGVHDLDIRGVNRALAVVMAVVLLFSLQRIGYELWRFKKSDISRFGSSSVPAVTETKEISGLNKAVSSYTEVIDQRDIFTIGATKRPVPDTKVADAVSEAVEATKNLKLVGISWSNDPYAMIEDDLMQRTFFVKRGQAIGAVKVQAIFKYKVILSYKGEEVELT